MTTNPEKADDIKTLGAFWECACERRFIHARDDRRRCPLCAAAEEDMPDAHVSDLRAENMFVPPPNVSE